MHKIQDEKLLLTTAGAETYLIYLQNVRLREFCGFDLFDQPDELARFERESLSRIASAALRSGAALLLDALVWRANADFIDRLGYPERGLEVEDVNRIATERTRAFIRDWRSRTPEAADMPMYVNGDVGPRGDGYRVEGDISIEAAHAYHRRQAHALARAGVDVLTALTMTSVNEAIGLARAASEVGLPCIVSPTVETDGRTPDGLSLGEFIERTEEGTGGSPLFYMVNCAHPVHLEGTLNRAGRAGAGWLKRFKGFRANASTRSHEELDNSTDLDRGHPEALASQLAHLRAEFDLSLLGGCCGTDHEHLECIAAAVSRAPAEKAAS